MLISKKSRYALRAVLELARRQGQGPVKIADIAQTQTIPQRFLEAILLQLKRAGHIASRRGSEGGYFLTVEPDQLTVGDIVRTIQGPTEPLDCLGDKPSEDCPLRENCAFIPVWNELKTAIDSVYDSMTFAELIRRQYEEGRCGAAATYSI